MDGTDLVNSAGILIEAYLNASLSRLRSSYLHCLVQPAGCLIKRDALGTWTDNHLALIPPLRDLHCEHDVAVRIIHSLGYHYRCDDSYT